MGKINWLLTFIASILVVMYSTVQYVFFSPAQSGLIYTKLHIEHISLNTVYYFFLYLHIAGGAIALLTGALNFRNDKNRSVHKRLGRIYILSVLAGGLAGFVIALKASGGMIAWIGLFILDLLWLFTTFMAYREIRQKHIEAHIRWMFRSFSLTFAGFTLRFWLNLLMFGCHLGFETSYQWSVWLSWTINFIVIEIWIRKKFKGYHLKPQLS